jgi:hypothetical protein
MQSLCAFVPLPDLRLVQREAEPLSDFGRKTRQPIKRVDKPNQLPQLFRLVRHRIHHMLKLA